MKKQDSKNHVSHRVFKQYFLYLYSDVFGDFFLAKMKQKKSIKNEDSLKAFLNRCKVDILILMQKRNVPVHWLQTFFNAIDTGELDLPLHEGISLRVGDYQINNDNFEEDRIRKSGASAVTIKITSQASPTQIKQFMKDNSKLISRLEILLNLPSITYPRLDNFEGGFDIHLMKDFEKLSYNKIAKVLEKAGKTITIDSIKRTVKNYRKYLSKP